MTKDKFNWKFCFCCGLFLWLIINLLQGSFTEIHEDEAYYALYGEHLAWGYFDHPPLVGLMTFLSCHLFSGLLGVRFFTVLVSCLSLFVIWKIAIGGPFDPSPSSGLRALSHTKVEAVKPVETPTSKEVLIFFIIACSVVMFNIYGFVTTPDVGLILFSALFLLEYQRYLAESSWKNTLLMGIMMAGMIYSKYHAFLLLGLIVLSNLKLLKDGKFYVACLVAMVLLIPHILWQVNNDFPSFKYHLMQRSEPFRWSYFLEYLPNQLLIFNPFTFGAVVYVLIKRKKTSLPYIDWLRLTSHRTNSSGNDMPGNLVFERGLSFILIGFFFFFWLMAFRGHVEPHWTIVSVIPVVVLLYRAALTDFKLKKYIQFIILPSLVFVLAFRVALLTPLASRFGFSDKEAYYQAVGQVADGHPVVFRGSFQQPALYHYYTRKESSTLKSYYDRKTQYDLWQFDTAWTGQPVFICGSVLNRSTVVEVDQQQVEGYLMQGFQSPNRLITDFNVTNFEAEKPLVLHHGDTLQVDFSIYNPLDKRIDFQYDEMGMIVVAQYLFTNSFAYCFYDMNIQIEPHSSYTNHLFTVVGDHIPFGKNRFTLGIGDGVSTFNTEENHIEVTVK